MNKETQLNKLISDQYRREQFNCDLNVNVFDFDYESISAMSYSCRLVKSSNSIIVELTGNQAMWSAILVDNQNLSIITKGRDYDTYTTFSQGSNFVIPQVLNP